MNAGAEKLVMMANQIAEAFALQRGDRAAEIAGHIRSFWAPPMRARIAAHLSAGGQGLSPLAAEAVARLRDEAASAPR